MGRPSVCLTFRADTHSHAYQAGSAWSAEWQGLRALPATPSDTERSGGGGGPLVDDGPPDGAAPPLSRSVPLPVLLGRVLVASPALAREEVWSVPHCQCAVSWLSSCSVDISVPVARCRWWTWKVPSCRASSSR